MTITNELDVPIYLESVQPDRGDPVYVHPQEYVLVDDASGELLHSHADACDGELACPALADDPCVGCDPGPPYRRGAIRIEPGGAYPATPWSSLVWTDGVVARSCIVGECFSPDAETVSCPRQVPYDGVFVVATARASTSLDGEDCDATTDGWCETAAGATPIDPTLTARGGFDFPTSSLDLVFVP